MGTSRRLMVWTSVVKTQPIFLFLALRSFHLLGLSPAFSVWQLFQSLLLRLCGLSVFATYEIGTTPDKWVPPLLSPFWSLGSERCLGELVLSWLALAGQFAYSGGKWPNLVLYTGSAAHRHKEWKLLSSTEPSVHLWIAQRLNSLLLPEWPYPLSVPMQMCAGQLLTL